MFCFSLCNCPLWLNNPNPFAMVPPLQHIPFSNFVAVSATVDPGPDWAKPRQEGADAETVWFRQPCKLTDP